MAGIAVIISQIRGFVKGFARWRRTRAAGGTLAARRLRSRRGIRAMATDSCGQVGRSRRDSCARVEFALASRDSHDGGGLARAVGTFAERRLCSRWVRAMAVDSRGQVGRSRRDGCARVGLALASRDSRDGDGLVRAGGTLAARRLRSRWISARVAEFARWRRTRAGRGWDGSRRDGCACVGFALEARGSHDGDGLARGVVGTARDATAELALDSRSRRGVRAVATDSRGLVGTARVATAALALDSRSRRGVRTMAVDSRG